MILNFNQLVFGHLIELRHALHALQRPSPSTQITCQLRCQIIIGGQVRGHGGLHVIWVSCHMYYSIDAIYYCMILQLYGFFIIIIIKFVIMGFSLFICFKHKFAIKLGTYKITIRIFYNWLRGPMTHLGHCISMFMFLQWKLWFRWAKLAPLYSKLDFTKGGTKQNYPRKENSGPRETL